MKTAFAALALSFAVLMSVQTPASAMEQPSWAGPAFERGIGD